MPGLTAEYGVVGPCSRQPPSATKMASRPAVSRSQGLHALLLPVVSFPPTEMPAGERVEARQRGREVLCGKHHLTYTVEQAAG